MTGAKVTLAAAPGGGERLASVQPVFSYADNVVLGRVSGTPAAKTRLVRSEFSSRDCSKGFDYRDLALCHLAGNRPVVVVHAAGQQVAEDHRRVEPHFEQLA